MRWELKHSKTFETWRHCTQTNNPWKTFSAKPMHVICSNLLLRFHHAPPGHTWINPRVLEHKLLTSSIITASSIQQAADYIKSISDMVLLKLAQIKNAVIRGDNTCSQRWSSYQLTGIEGLNGEGRTVLDAVQLIKTSIRHKGGVCRGVYLLLKRLPRQATLSGWHFQHSRDSS